MNANLSSIGEISHRIHPLRDQNRNWVALEVRDALSPNSYITLYFDNAEEINRMITALDRALAALERADRVLAAAVEVAG